MEVPSGSSAGYKENGAGVSCVFFCLGSDAYAPSGNKLTPARLRVVFTETGIALSRKGRDPVNGIRSASRSSMLLTTDYHNNWTPRAAS